VRVPQLAAVLHGAHWPSGDPGAEWRDRLSRVTGREVDVVLARDEPTAPRGFAACLAEALARTHNWPLQRGFDRFYGTIHGAGSFYDPSSLVRDNQLITPANDPEYHPVQYYYTEALSDQATRFIAEHKKGRPFFLYLTYTAAHWPMHATGQGGCRSSG